MLFGKEFAPTQFAIINTYLPIYKEYCSYSENPTANNLKLAEKCAIELNSLLLPIVKKAYAAENLKKLSPIEIHQVFHDFIYEQLRAVDFFDSFIAKRSLGAIQKQIEGFPAETVKELNQEIVRLTKQISVFSSEKARIIDMTCPGREKYIKLLQKNKANGQIIDFALKVQNYVQKDPHDNSKPRQLGPNPALELPVLFETFNDILNTLENPLLERDLEYSVLLEQARLFPIAINAKLLENIKQILSKEKFVTPLLELAKQTTEQYEALDHAHAENYTFFLKEFNKNFALFREYLEILGYIEGPLSAIALAQQEVSNNLAGLINKIGDLYYDINNTEQRNLFAGLAIQQFIAKIKSLAPKQDDSKYPVLVSFNAIVGLLTQVGVLVCKEFMQKARATITDAQLPFYISLLSGLQLEMTGESTKSILKLLLSLQEQFIDSLSCEELKAYQGDLDIIYQNESNFKRFANFNNFTSIHTQLNMDDDTLRKIRENLSPEDRGSMNNYRLAVHELISARLNILENPNRHRLS